MRWLLARTRERLHDRNLGGIKTAQHAEQIRRGQCEANHFAARIEQRSTAFPGSIGASVWIHVPGPALGYLPTGNRKGTAANAAILERKARCNWHEHRHLAGRVKPRANPAGISRIYLCGVAIIYAARSKSRTALHGQSRILWKLRIVEA